MFRTALFTLCTLLLLPTLAAAHDNHSSMSVDEDLRCISSNGSPTHEIGVFPNAGNPHSFQEQTVSVCVDASPEITGDVTERTNASGITLTGIIIRPGTADYYDPSSPRGFSRDSSSGWSLEGMGAADLLGMDANDAHVDHRGLYHYHGVSEGLLGSADGTLVGYAADGFEIHYVASVDSSWQLKSGTRPSGPGGTYDGTYVQDWEYVAGSGDLDACNGGLVDGEYTYFATDTYPFFPRCFVGDVSSDFLGRP